MILRERLMKKYAGIIIISLILAAMASMQAGADEIYYQHGMDGYTGGEDATITSSGTWPTDYPHRLRLRYDGQERYNTLIRFEGLAELGENSHVSGATLTLTYQHENVAWNPATVDIHQCMRSWSDPDWTYADPCSSIKWGTFGAQDPCTDRGELVGEDTYMGPRKGYPTWTQYTDGSKFEFTLDAPMVQSWIEQPDTNYGLILIMNYEAATDVTFSSNEDSDPCTAPLLTVYVAPGIIVPPVVGLPTSTAVAEIEDEGFTVEIRAEYSTVPEYCVIRQDPCAGSVVPAGSTVTLWESWGPQPMPDFNGDYITNLIDFNQLASEWMSCDPCVVTTDMTADGCVQVDDLVFLVEGWLQYHCKNRPKADISGNCCVDMEDLAILLSEWLLCDGETMANIDGDDEGCVDLSDMSILSSQWGLYGEAYNQ